MIPGETGPPRRLRVLLYAQHLSGVGHFVRMHEIGRALASRHEVVLIDGGREVPRSDHGGMVLMSLPRIERRDAGLTPVDGAQTLSETMTRRAAALAQAVSELRPDVLVVEHFPFSKWELREEIAVLVAAVLNAQPGARIVCSLRDIPRQTSYENCPPEIWQHTVLLALDSLFDAVMVHGEEHLTPLSSYFPAVGEMRIPIAHTGIVAESATATQADGRGAVVLTGGAPYVIASIGGGSDPSGLLGSCAEAWELLEAQDATAGRKLILCTGIRGGTETLMSVSNPRVLVTGFDSRFLQWLAAADLSVSYAGYNTCANLLAAGVPAVLIPNPRMSDQAARAAVMESLGAARLMPASALTGATLAGAMLEALGQRQPQPVVPIDGAARAALFIEQLT